MKQKVTVVLTVRNEEKMIRDCLESVKDWADEIVVVDDSSTDKTIEIVKKYTSKIFNFNSNGYVEASRNFAIQKAKNDWILVLDADERVGKKLLEKLDDINTEEITHVYIPRKNIIFGKWIEHTGWWPDYQIRYFLKNKISWPDKIHSKPVLTGKEERLNPEEDLSILHENYQTVSQFILRMDRYTTIEADQSEGEFKWPDLIKKPSNEFYRRFFVGNGYKDNLHGLALSILMVFYVFVVQLKLWEKKKFVETNQKEFMDNLEKEAKTVAKEFGFHFMNQKINNTKNIFQKNFLRVKSKI